MLEINNVMTEVGELLQVRMAAFFGALQGPWHLAQGLPCEDAIYATPSEVSDRHVKSNVGW